MSRCQSRPGHSTPKDAGTTPARLDRATLDQLLLAHHPAHPLAVHLDAELAADEAADHPVAVGRVALRRLDDRDVDRIGHRTPLGRTPRLRPPVEGLPADLQHPRHRRQGPALGDQHPSVSDALAHSHARNAFPAISSS